MSPLSIALKLAAHGWPVFPCSQNKAPAIGKVNGGRGFLDASRDLVVIRAMFSRGNAALVGVPTGEITGVDVLDLDYRHGAAGWEEAHKALLPETRIHQTQSGGRHLLFVHAPGIRNTASKIAPGVDVRGEGGYVVFPPSDGYSLVFDASIAHWPDALLRLVLPPPEQPARATTPAPRGPLPQHQLDRITTAALARVSSAPEGAKHFQLRNAALLLGGIAEQAGFSDDSAVGWLMGALPASVCNWNSAKATAAWGLQQGRLRPLDLLADDRPARVPDPRRKKAARAAFRLLRMGVTTAELITALQDQNARRADPLPPGSIAETALWVARQFKANADAR